MTMARLLFVLSVLGSYYDAVVKSDQVIAPTVGYALQDYLCSGPLKSNNTTVALDDGEHLISSGPCCNISNGGNITITGSSMKNTAVRCEGEGRVFAFISAQKFTMERITFVNCGIILVAIQNILVTECTFRNSSIVANSQLENKRSSMTIAYSLFINNDNGDGVVTVVLLTGDVSITNCIFQNNNATRGFGGGVSVNLVIGDVNISNSTFQNNSATSFGGGVGLILTKSNVIIRNCIFQNNSANDDGGVGLVLSTGNVSIRNCTFQNNSAAGYGGGVGLGSDSLRFKRGNVSIRNCTFQNNTAKGNGGGGVKLLSQSTGDVSITNSTFQSNTATGDGGGGVLLDILSTGNVSITDCTFLNNSATDDGGGVLLKLSEGNVNTTNCTFHNNSAAFGGAIFIVSTRTMLISGSTFTNNTALVGAAVCAVNSEIPFYRVYFLTLTPDTVPFSHLILQDVIVKDSHCSCSDYSDMRGGAIYFNGMKVDIYGNSISGSQFSSNSPMGAIQGTNGILHLHGNIKFTNNTGVNGGAISLYNVPLYFYEKCAVQFSRNVATGFGGAIYDDGNQQKLMQPTSNLNKCIIRLIKDCDYYCEFNTSMFSITFIDNHAQLGGHSVYATPLYDCFYCIGVYHSGDLIPFECQNLTSYFTTTPLPENINEIQVLSFPKDVHLCDCMDPNLCNVKNQHQGMITTHPGRTVRLQVTSVDDGNNLSPSVVYTLVDTNSIISPNITLGPTQKTQWIGTVCGTLEYQIYGPEMASLKLLLSNYPSNVPTIVEVKLLPCEPGFTLVSNSSTGVMECNCSEFFTSFGVICNEYDGTIASNRINWIGMYNSTLPALTSTCPMDYCNGARNKMSLSRPGDLCNGGRTGIICGRCHGNYSVIFGSSRCKICSNMWLTTLVLFAVLGVLLVAALFFLNLTVTQGTLYGLIFYANIIQVNSSIFFSQSVLRPLQVIVSFVNLDLGFPLCFFDGMDDADKAGLQFVFPAYLLMLTIAVIVVCHYCLQRSPTTSTSSCLYRFPIIIGERAVGVLSTLIYLSYSKLLRTVIDIFTFATLHLPSGEMYVWFYDGNVEYFRGKHAVLFVISMVTCILFLLPYTFVLTFIPIIEKYSEHNRLFSYLHQKANQIKPMNDAHYAPYKGEWRWWLGARLWLVVVMYTLNPVYSSDNPSLLLSIQATMVIIFMLVQARIEPFGQPFQKTDKCNRRTSFYNQLYNCLDLMYLLNYTALALSMSYILDQSSHETQITVSVGVLVGLYVVVLMVTVLYHFIVAILKVCKTYDRAREKINGLFERKNEVKVPIKIELNEPTTKTVSTTTVTVSLGLREPLCED